MDYTKMDFNLLLEMLIARASEISILSEKNAEIQRKEIQTIKEEIIKRHTIKNLTLQDFMGKKIIENYCNGWFNKDYNLYGSIIIGHTRDSIEIMTSTGEKLKEYFDEEYIENLIEMLQKWTGESQDFDIMKPYGHDVKEG